MNGNIVSAARWFGFCLIVSSVVLVVGLFVVADHCSKRMSSAIRDAGRASNPVVRVPSSFSISHRFNGGLDVDLSPNNKSINLDIGSQNKPIKVNIEKHDVNVQTDNPILYKEKL